MTLQPSYLVDSSSERIAALHVIWTGDLYSGPIDLDATPPFLNRLFEEFEEIVEGKMLGLADEIEQKIEALPLRVVFANGTEAAVQDLQVYPSTKLVSFKICQPSTDTR